MEINYKTLISHVLNERIHKPLSGTLSGHAAGEPFEKVVYRKMKEMYPDNVYKQYDYFWKTAELDLLRREINFFILN